MQEPLKTNIYSYLDYRKFLFDLYQERKSHEKYFTYRYLAEKVGLRSVGFITWIFQGKRNLSDHLILRFADAFRLSRQEAAFFELLVRFNQARSHEDKKHYFDKIASLNRFSAVTTDVGQYMYYDKWYYSAIRELICLKPFKEDYRLLSSTLIPAITPAEAKKAVDLLLELGFIMKDSTDTFFQKDKTISTGQSWRSLAISNYQIQAFELGKKAIDAIAKSERDLSTMTLSCSQATFSAMREKLRTLRAEFADMAKADPEPERVYQCNFQMFPLSKALHSPERRARK
jgi:uncharacterized protein (TIGR02147 family)